MFKKSILSLTFLILFVILFQAFTSPATKEPGDKIDDFTLQGADGNLYTLGDMKSQKAVVVMFWSTTCPNVQPYTERINSLANKYSSKGISFWAVNSNTNESMDDVKIHAQKNNYPFPSLKDFNNSVADLFGATRTPEVFMIDPSTETVIYHGRVDDNRDETKVTSHDLQNALDELISGKEITVKNTKFFGCGIKRD